MPLFRIGEKLHYYAHVPKCGGTSVETYLRDRFGTLAFVDTRYLSQPEDHRWTRSSPQHVAWADLTRMVPEGWIASAFGVVRHPLARMKSAYVFQRDVEGTVPEGQGIDAWFANWVELSVREPFRFDNHLRPQSDIVPAFATVFQLEAGLDSLVPHLDTLAGAADGPRSLPHVNEIGKSSSTAPAEPSAETVALVASYYAEDFRRFGYDPAAPLPKKAPRPAKPASGIGAVLKSALRGRRRA